MSRSRIRLRKLKCNLFQFQFIYVCVFLLLFPSAHGAGFDSSSPALVRSRNKVYVPQQHQQQQQQQQQLLPQNVLQIIETEEYDANGKTSTWLGHKARWSDLNGAESEPPPTIDAPAGFKFEGDWKIVTSTNRDSLGWEYSWTENQPATRRRLWLRTVVVIPKQAPTSLVALVKDSWNFKGFGLSFYKSLLTARSFGMSFRLPILNNIDWWERQPAFPSLSISVAGFFPDLVMFLISTSVNVDFLAWVMGRTFRYALYGVSVLLLAICRLLFLPVALLLYPSRQQLVLPTFPLPTIPKSPPVFSLTISQRLGMSIQWRASTEFGRQFRLSYYYEYVPTILHLTEIFYNNKQLSDTKLTNWLRRKIASLGVSCGVRGLACPFPPDHFLSMSLSMSGFYFRNKAKASRKEHVALTTAIKEEEPSATPSKKQKLSSAAG